MNSTSSSNNTQLDDTDALGRVVDTPSGASAEPCVESAELGGVDPPATGRDGQKSGQYISHMFIAHRFRCAVPVCGLRRAGRCNLVVVLPLE